MKKLFIGCGILVLLILGALGYVAYQVYPDASVGQERMVAALVQLKQLDQTHPFESEAQTQLDGQRFVQVLETRVNQTEYLRGLIDDLESLSDDVEDDEELGLIDSIKLFIRGAKRSFLLMGEAAGVFAENPAELEMGPSEFAWHTKVIWACLRRVDQGAGEPGLEELRGRFEEFEEFYMKQRQSNDDMPVLDALIGDIPAAVIAQASVVLASDIERVRLGLFAPELDHLYLLMPVQQLEDLGVVVEPQDAGESAGR